MSIALYDTTHASDWRSCGRCGIRRRVNQVRDSGLCRDCRSVANALGEPHVWLRQEKVA